MFCTFYQTLYKSHSLPTKSNFELHGIRAYQGIIVLVSKHFFKNLARIRNWREYNDLEPFKKIEDILWSNLPTPLKKSHIKGRLGLKHGTEVIYNDDAAVKKFPQEAEKPMS